jgi:hypothetical protein
VRGECAPVSMMYYQVPRRKRPRAQRIHSHVHGARVCELSVGLAVVAVLVRDPRAYSVCVRADDIVTIVPWYLV